MRFLLTPAGRVYDTKIGRFLSRDPAGGREGGYLYCHNEPTGFADPTGLDPVEKKTRKSRHEEDKIEEEFRKARERYGDEIPPEAVAGILEGRAEEDIREQKLRELKREGKLREEYHGTGEAVARQRERHRLEKETRWWKTKTDDMSDSIYRFALKENVWNHARNRVGIAAEKAFDPSVHPELRQAWKELGLAAAGYIRRFELMRSRGSQNVRLRELKAKREAARRQREREKENQERIGKGRKKFKDPKEMEEARRKMRANKEREGIRWMASVYILDLDYVKVPSIMIVDKKLPDGCYTTGQRTDADCMYKDVTIPQVGSPPKKGFLYVVFSEIWAGGAYEGKLCVIYISTDPTHALDTYVKMDVVRRINSGAYIVDPSLLPTPIE